MLRDPYRSAWQHVIKLERWFENTETARRPFLLEASGRSPPEDVGGADGYAALLAAITDLLPQNWTCPALSPPSTRPNRSPLPVSEG
jgi:hypothetical protein